MDDDRFVGTVPDGDPRAETAALTSLVYGEAFIETAHNKIVVLIESLKDFYATNDTYSPIINYVYDTHSIAKLQLNGVTVDLESGDPGQFEMLPDYKVDYRLKYEVRIHTDYDDGINDIKKNRRLLNSLLNKLNANRYLGDYYRIIEISEIDPNRQFEESASLGGSFIVTVLVSIEHLQENV